MMVHSPRWQRIDTGAVGRAAYQAAAAAFAAGIKPALLECLAAGMTSPSGIARALNERGVRARRGGSWSHTQVAILLRRLEAAGEAVR